MTIGLIGRKCGMTRIYTEDGRSIPVSVIEIETNYISQVKTKASDGYEAVQITTGSRRSSRITSAQAGHFSKARVAAGSTVMEFRVSGSRKHRLGDESGGVEIFSEGQKVNVVGKSKGKGFQGTIKRWNFRGQDNTHGNSISHRAPGSIGQCQTPGRVFKGKKMSGHMGSKYVTTKSLEIIRIDKERKLLIVKGAVPGAPGNNLVVRPSARVCD